MYLLPRIVRALLQACVLFSFCMAQQTGAPTNSSDSPAALPFPLNEVRIDSNLIMDPEIMECSLNTEDKSQWCTRVLRAPNPEHVLELRLHFNRFRLPSGSFVRVGNEDDTEFYDFRGDNQGAFTAEEDLGDTGDETFFAMSVDGSAVEVALILPNGGRSWNASMHRVAVDYFYARMDSEYAEREEPVAKHFMANCGEMDYHDVECLAKNDPKRRLTTPVAKLSNGGGACTAFRVGPENRVLSNWHCFQKTGATARGAELRFFYQNRECKSRSLRSKSLKVQGDKVLSIGSGRNDFALFTVATSQFSLLAANNVGWLGIDPSSPKHGTPIAIVQHPFGSPKQIAFESDAPKANGLCTISKGVGNRGYGYRCDTQGGSSGSPIISIQSRKALMIHAWGDYNTRRAQCVNSGEPLANVWPHIKKHFTRGEPPDGHDPTTVDPGGDGGDVLGAWSTWGPCSVSCGKGARRRRCVAPAGASKPVRRLTCSGGIASESCTMQPCPSAPTSTSKPSTPAPSSTPKPSTPAPSSPSTPSTPAPSSTPKPSTPAPSSTPKPSTPAPSSTPKPPTSVPSPTKAPSQTGTGRHTWWIIVACCIGTPVVMFLIYFLSSRKRDTSVKPIVMAPPARHTVKKHKKLKQKHERRNNRRKLPSRAKVEMAAE